MNPNPDQERVFTDWMGSHGGIVAKIARSFARSPADLEDLRQEMLLQLWTSLDSFAGQAKASTWIYRVSLNTALMWRRSASRAEGRIDPAAGIGEIAEARPDPAENAAKDDLLTTLFEAIRSLAESDRALVLLMLDGVPYREIGEITGLTENHVGVALTRARGKLAERLKGVRNELG
jgi:RNA polymerase sigma-70 factor (ECF subfamily)